MLEKYGFKTPLKSKTIDLFDIIKKETGQWISLDALSLENLGRGKLMKGDALAHADIVTQKKGCKGDVLNTKELYELLLRGKLSYKHLKNNTSQNDFDEEDFKNENSESILLSDMKCPKCGGTNFDEFETIDEEHDDFDTYPEMKPFECFDCGALFDYDGGVFLE